MLPLIVLPLKIPTKRLSHIGPPLTRAFESLEGANLKGNKRDKLNGTNGAKVALFRRFSLIFADYRFS